MTVYSRVHKAEPDLSIDNDLDALKDEFTKPIRSFSIEQIEAYESDMLPEGYFPGLISIDNRYHQAKWVDDVFLRSRPGEKDRSFDESKHILIACNYTGLTHWLKYVTKKITLRPEHIFVDDSIPQYKSVGFIFKAVVKHKEDPIHNFHYYNDALDNFREYVQELNNEIKSISSILRSHTLEQIASRKKDLGLID